MTRVHENLPDPGFVVPESIETSVICRKSGKLAVGGVCDRDPRGNATYTEYFAKGTVPRKSVINMLLSPCVPPPASARMNSARKNAPKSALLCPRTKPVKPTTPYLEFRESAPYTTVCPRLLKRRKEREKVKKKVMRKEKTPKKAGETARERKPPDSHPIA